jgi:antitoxin StbD
MNSMSVVDLMKSMVPITRFNKGEAAKIFDEVENTGTKIVVKNNRPACVLISPAQYESLMEMLSDYMLLIEAQKRVASNDNAENVSHEEMMRQLGITEDDLADIDVDIE